MKKTIKLLLLVATLCLAGCSDDYSNKKAEYGAHIVEKSRTLHYEVVGYESVKGLGIGIKTKKHGTILVSVNNCYLYNIKNHCPICGWEVEFD